MGLGDIFGGSSRNQTVSTTFTPWQAEDLTNLYSEARQRYETGAPDISGSQQLTQTAIDQLLSAASGYNPAAVQQAQQTLFNAGDPNANPAFQQYMQFLNDEMTRAYQQTLPRVAAEGVLTNTLAGSDQQKIKLKGQENLLRQIGGQTAGAVNTAYGQGLNAVLGGIQANPNVINALTTPANLTTTAAGLKQGSELMPFNLENMLFNQYADLISRPQGGTTVQTGPAMKTGGIAGALGGLATGAGVAGLLPESMASANPYIIGGSALLGLLS